MQMTVDAVWCRQARLIVFSQFIIILALDMSDPYWPLVLSSLHFLNPQLLQYWSGAIYIAPFLMTIFTTLAWTRLGERIGYKKMVLRAGCALVLTQWSLLFFLHNLWFVFSIRLLQGALAGFTAAAQAWSLTITPGRVHSHLLGRLQASTAMGSIIGPVCGGIVAHYYSYAAIFLISGCLCLLTTGFLAKYLAEDSKSKKISDKKPNLTCGQGEKRENLILLLICGTQALRWMPTPFFALYVVQRLHANNLTLGFIYGTIALALSFTTANVGRLIDKRSRFMRMKILLVLALLTSGFVQYGFAFISQTYLAFILSLVWGIGLGIISLTLFTFLLQDINDSIRARSVGLGNTALKLGNLLGIIAGALIQAEGHFTLSFIVIACLYFLIAVLASCYRENT